MKKKNTRCSDSVKFSPELFERITYGCYPLVEEDMTEQQEYLAKVKSSHETGLCRPWTRIDEIIRTYYR